MVGDLPIKRWRVGNIDCSVWANKRKLDNGEEVEFKTVSLRKSWKQTDGWHDQTISNLRKNDLQKVILLMQKAQEEVLMAKDDREEVEEDE